MIRTRLLVVALATAGSTAAQIAVTVRAHTALTVSAVARSATIPAGTDLTGGASLTATDPNPVCSSAATTYVRVTQDPARPAVHFGSSAISLCSFGAVAGSHDILVTLSAPVATAGSLRLEGSAVTGTATCEFDLGNDGTVDLAAVGLPTAPDVVVVPAVVGPAGLVVRVRTGAMIGLVVPGPSYTNATVAFEAGGGNLVPVGTACGPALTGEYRIVHRPATRTETLTFAASGSAVTPYAFFVLGVTPLAVVIPPFGCTLRTDIIVPVPATVRADGSAALSIPLPLGLQADLRTQFLAATLDPAGNQLWRMSEALWVRLP